MSWVDEIKVGDRLTVLINAPWGARVKAGDVIDVVETDWSGIGAFLYRVVDGEPLEWVAYMKGADEHFEPVGQPKKRSDNLRPELEWLNTIQPGDELEIFDPYDRNYAKPGDRVIYVSDDGDMERGGAHCYVKVKSPTGLAKMEHLSGCAFRFREVAKQERLVEPKVVGFIAARLQLREAIRMRLVAGVTQ